MLMKKVGQCQYGKLFSLLAYTVRCELQVRVKTE